MSFFETDSGFLWVQFICFLAVGLWVVLKVLLWCCARRSYPVPHRSDKSVVLITGASTGIGYAAALHVESLGFSVLAGVRRADDGKRLVENARHGRIVPLILDVANPASIQAALGTVTDELNRRGARLVGLFNNAGIAVAMPLEIFPLAAARQMFEVNFMGALQMTQTFLPLLRASRGRIICTGSAGGRLTPPALAVYAATKFALRAMCDGLRAEVAPLGVSVSLLECGAIKTPIADKFDLSGFHDAPADVQNQYSWFRQYGAVLAELNARYSTTDVTDAAVEDALCSARPLSHYFVGMDAKFVGFARSFVPERVWDAIFSKQFRIGPPPAGV